MSDMAHLDHEMPQLDARMLEIARYWDSLRGDRAVPGRVEIRPTEIARHLSRLAILARPRAGTVRLRLVGAHVMNRIGMELRGMPFRALFDLDDRGTAMAAAEAAISTPAVTVLALSSGEGPHAALEGHMMILPLCDTTGALTRAMALYSEVPNWKAAPYEEPGRLRVTGTWVLDIPEVGPLLPAGQSDAPNLRRISQRAARDLAIAVAPDADIDAPAMPLQAPKVGAPTAAPILRLIEGGRS